MARVFGQGLAAPVGSVLPLRRAIQDGARRWQSGKWFFRGDAMFLLPGDSPIGLRLPLDSLPWVDPDHIEPAFEPDPFAPREAAADSGDACSECATSCRAGRAKASSPVPQDAPVLGREEPDVVRTALAVEARDGMLHVFLPAAVRGRGLARADRRGRGHRGRDRPQGGAGGLSAAGRPARCCTFSVTPDPGVIEVNIHPAASWAEQVARTEAALRGGARRSGWRPRNSCWTAAMSAPAAATMW